MAKIGILGGTFDPIHNGHIELAKTALKELSLDRIIFIPAYIPPHKTGRRISKEQDRIRMTELAIEDIEEFSVSDIEVVLQGKSYTARTLTELKKEYEQLVFIMGADSFMALDSWYHPEIIFEKAVIACAYRDNISRETLLSKADEYRKKYNGESVILHMSNIAISSTEIRKMLSNNDNEAIKSLISPKVYKYIKENNLKYEV